MPSDLRYLNVFTQKMSAAMQHSLEQVMTDINDELGKFGYSIGAEFDYDDDEDEYDDDNEIDDDNDELSGESYYFITNNATKSIVRNAILSVDWNTRNVTTFAYKKEGSKLKLEVDVEIIELDMSEMEEILGDEDPNKLNPRDGVLPESKDHTKTECKDGDDCDCGCKDGDKNTTEDADRFDDKCRAGTVQKGTKVVDGRQMPNCVKVEGFEEGKLTDQNKDDLIKTLADLLYKGNEQKAKQVFDNIPFNQYLELATALVDDDVSKAKKIVSESNESGVPSFSTFVQK